MGRCGAPTRAIRPPRRAPLRGMRDRSLRGRVPPISALVTRRTRATRLLAGRSLKGEGGAPGRFGVDHVGHWPRHGAACHAISANSQRPRAATTAAARSKAPAAKPACVGPNRQTPAIGVCPSPGRLTSCSPNHQPQHQPQAGTVNILIRKKDDHQNVDPGLRKEQQVAPPSRPADRPRRADHRNASDPPPDRPGSGPPRPQGPRRHRRPEIRGDPSKSSMLSLEDPQEQHVADQVHPTPHAETSRSGRYGHRGPSTPPTAPAPNPRENASKRASDAAWLG